MQTLMDATCRGFTSRGSDGDVDGDSGILDGRGVPFVLIETMGIYRRVFCDFGREFRMVDEDGETPKTTLEDNITVNGSGDDRGFLVNCIEGEGHGLSKGGTLMLQFNNDINSTGKGGYWCIVLYVKNPITITVEMVRPSQSRMKYAQSRLNNLNGGSLFTRVKVPRTIPFLSRTMPHGCMNGTVNDDTGLAALVESAAAKGIRKNREEEERLFVALDLEKNFDPVLGDAVMACFQALDRFVCSFRCLPSTATSTESGGNNNGNDENLTYFSNLVSARDDDDDVEPSL